MTQKLIDASAILWLLIETNIVSESKYKFKSKKYLMLLAIISEIYFIAKCRVEKVILS